MENVTLEIFLDDASRRYQCNDDGSPRLVGYGKRGRLFLCRKQAQYGDVEVDHWWMDWKSVYGDRNCQDSNHQTLIDIYWGMCTQKLTVTQRQVQESYLLAHLLPFARSKGSRRVLLDSVPARKCRSKPGSSDDTTDLDQMLRTSQEKEMDIVEFRDSTANAIGPPVFDVKVKVAYDRLAGELLEKGCDVLERVGNRGVEVTIDLWQTWMRTIGRRSGNSLDKQVLDMLSYECRAAVHRCYSAVWDHLIHLLADKHQLSDEEVIFHRFWHLDQLTTSDKPTEAHFHLFHGHVFALHPAGAEFMKTKTGRDLMGQWLTDPGPESACYGRMLNGLAVAVHHYALQNEVYAELRKKKPKCFSDIAQIEV